MVLVNLAFKQWLWRAGNARGVALWLKPVWCLPAWVVFVWLLFGTLLFTGQSVMALDTGLNTVALSDNTHRQALGPYIEYFEDASRELKISDILKGTFIWQKNKGVSVNQGFSNSSYWFRISLDNQASPNKQWLLEEAYPLLDTIELYVVQEGKVTGAQFSGDAMMVSKRPIHHEKFLFALNLANKGQVTLYLRIENTEAMEVTLRIWDRFAFNKYDQVNHVINGFIYGLLAVMALYNLLIFFTVKARAYLYYVYYVLVSVMFVGTQKGHFFAWFYPDYPLLHHFTVPVIIALTVSMVVLFLQRVLRLKTSFPVLSRVIDVGSVVGLGAAVVTANMYYQQLIIVVLLLLTFSMLLAFYMVAVLACNGNKMARIIIAGWFLIIICGCFLVMAKIGLMSNEFISSFGMQIAFSIEVVIFSLALSFRINEANSAKLSAEYAMVQERVKRIKAQDLTLEKERELRHTKEHALEQQKKLNETLEGTVKKRTLELERAMKNLNEVNADLQALSNQDGLTGVHNRRYFDRQSRDEWQRCIRDSTSLSVLLLDLDHFKHVNDNYGHQCGDYVLQQCAKVISLVACRPTDVVARYGGEEFVVLFPNTDITGAEHLAQLLVTSVSDQEIMYEGKQIPISVSIGVMTTWPSTKMKLEGMIRYADEALYQAKDNGRNTYVIHQAASTTIFPP